MTTLWKDEYKIGIDKIDDQHCQLFRKIENLLEIVRTGNGERNRMECMEIINFLVSYTTFHFDTEEKLQRKMGYVSYEKHVKIHENFKNTVEAYKDLLEKDFSAKTLKSFIGTLLAWLVNHVCVCDRKIMKNIPLETSESYADTEDLMVNVSQKLLTKMYDIPILQTRSYIYEGTVTGAVIVRTIAQGNAKHMFLYGMSDKLAEVLYNKFSGMMFENIDLLDDIEKSALTEMGNIFSTYAMGMIDQESKVGVQFESSLYIREYNDAQYNLSNSVTLEITTEYGKMDFLYSRLK